MVERKGAYKVSVVKHKGKRYLQDLDVDGNIKLNFLDSIDLLGTETSATPLNEVMKVWVLD